MKLDAICRAYNYMKKQTHRSTDDCFMIIFALIRLFEDREYFNNNQKGKDFTEVKELSNFIFIF